MHKIESLINTLCPNGVEYKTLGEVCKIDGGKLNANKASESGAYAFFSYDYENAKFIDKYAWDTEALIVCKKDKGECCRYFKGKFNAFQWMRILHNFTDDVNIHFVKYYLNHALMKFLQKQTINISLPYIAIETMNSIPIPIPPLEVQKEIIIILDMLKELTAKLTAELTARKKQYEYYRHTLLDFGTPDNPKNGTKFELLGNLGKVRMCRRILKQQTTRQGDIPFYKIGTFGGEADAFIDRSLFEKYKTKYPYPKKGQILISASGTIGKLVVFDGIDAYFQDSNIVWIDNDENKVTNKFLYHFYQTNPWNASSGTTIKRLYNNNIREIKIPIPPLEVQEKIVKILDKFESLTHDLQEGLPAEIQARAKQYEYYRNQLLTFKKLES